MPLLGGLNVVASAPAAAAATVTPKQSLTPAKTGEFAQVIDAMLTKLAADHAFDGVVLVAMNGEVLLGKGYGLANIEWGVPHTLQSKFRIASVTKSFVAIQSCN